MYTQRMQTKRTKTFSNWLKSLDHQARAKVLDRLVRMSAGNFGDHKSVGKGVSELRINYGPGYRVYYTVRKDGTVVILLGGGTKKRQGKDIEAAQFQSSRLK